MPSIDKIEYSKRLLQIQSWIIEGIPAGLIVSQILSNNWSDAKKEEDRIRTAERMLKAARDKWMLGEEQDLNRKRKLRIARLERIGNKLEEKFKATPAGVMAQVAVEKLIVELEGSKAATKLEVTGKNGEPIKTETTITKHEVIFKDFGE